VPGEHIKLIALLNKFGFNPISKHAALVLAEKLLNEGWGDLNCIGKNKSGLSVDTLLL
jgi:hypothetical protein